MPGNDELLKLKETFKHLSKDQWIEKLEGMISASNKIAVNLWTDVDRLENEIVQLKSQLDQLNGKEPSSSSQTKREADIENKAFHEGIALGWRDAVNACSKKAERHEKNCPTPEGKAACRAIFEKIGELVPPLKN